MEIDTSSTLHPPIRSCATLRAFAVAASVCMGAASVARANATESVLYAFTGGTDGTFPAAGLLAVGTSLYGTTSGGYGNGNVFAVTLSGSEKSLYTFNGGADGADPLAGLLKSGAKLYGTTAGETTSGVGSGTVFSISKTGKEKVLHAFVGGTDGATPAAGLVDVGGAFFGTTSSGGGDGCAAGIGCGTVFMVTPQGVETVVYAFQGGADGAYPRAGLTEAGGALYGTAAGEGYGNGNVFMVTPKGVLTVLYSFKGGTDGKYPYSTMVAFGGALYGTTNSGGAHGYGTVFQVTTAGVETVLYSFKGGSDGEYPNGLIEHGNMFYGTTYKGGKFNHGTVFQLTPAGKKTVLYSFKGGSDGSEPDAGLIAEGGALYGTTFYGGGGTLCPYGDGCGTVFKVVP